jgi:hypothetical protein
VRGVGVQVDPGDVAGTSHAELVALEQEVGAVVIARVRAREALTEDEIGVLVWLGLLRLRERAGQRQHLGLPGRVEHVVVVAVVRDQVARILQLR